MKIDRAAFDAIRRHASIGYPYEICGFLIARKSSKEVIWARPTANSTTGNPQVHYQIVPKEHEIAEKELDRLGLEVVGYYHSHPDHPSYASNTDRLEAWPNAYYLVASCLNGAVVDAKVFVKPAWDSTEMFEEPLEVVDD